MLHLCFKSLCCIVFQSLCCFSVSKAYVASLFQKLMLHQCFKSLCCICVSKAYVASLFQKFMLKLCSKSLCCICVFLKLMLHLCFKSLCCICVSKAYLCGRYGGGYDLAARRKNATRESTATLKAWLNEHKKNPYPTKGEKIMLAIITKMTLTQVCTL
jgi:hypothetical protein